MLGTPFTTRALATTLAVGALGLGGIATASASPDQDQRYATMVKELGIPVNSPEEAGQVGMQICNQLDAGKVEPARTLRGILGTFTAKGLEKGQALRLVWGAVDVYCPQFGGVVGR